VIVHCNDTPGDNLHIKPLLYHGQTVVVNEVSLGILDMQMMCSEKDFVFRRYQFFDAVWDSVPLLYKWMEGDLYFIICRTFEVFEALK
jgi:hypothetical protein